MAARNAGHSWTDREHPHRSLRSDFERKNLTCIQDITFYRCRSEIGWYWGGLHRSVRLILERRFSDTTMNAQQTGRTDVANSPLPTPLTGPAAAIGRHLRIIVVENDALIGVLLAEMLEEMGHDVCAIEATEDGAVASAALRQPDLMIVDAWLGEGSGIVAVDKILLTGEMPHIFVSGDIARVRMLRPNSIMVQKPYREAEIAHAIRRATDKKS